MVVSPAQARAVLMYEIFGGVGVAWVRHARKVPWAGLRFSGSSLTHRGAATASAAERNRGTWQVVRMLCVSVTVVAGVVSTSAMLRLAAISIALAM